MHLIISKDKEEIRRTLNSLLKGMNLALTSFYPENFSPQAFFQEVETLPFLGEKKAVVVHELDQLPQESIQAVEHYLEKPTTCVSIFLTAKELAPQNRLMKLVKKKGKVTQFNDEKPWEKEKKLAEWLVEEANKEKVAISLQAAVALVQGVDHQSLQMELDKLICFAAGKQEITLEDISLLSTPVHNETLWQLGDAIFANATARALEIGHILLEEETSLFLLLGSLRSQFMTGIEVLALGREAAKKFPYLKGNLLEKKLRAFKKYGNRRLIQGALLIFDAELKAKQAAIEAALLLELLIIKLSYDTISFAQLTRASC